MIFITGGTGLLGAHILLKLSQNNTSFVALKRKNSSLKIVENIFKYYKAKELFDKIDNKKSFLELAESTSKAEGVKIFIGSENFCFASLRTNLRMACSDAESG